MDINKDILTIRKQVQEVAQLLEFKSYIESPQILQKYIFEIRKNASKGSSSSKFKVYQLLEELFGDLIDDLDQQYSKYTKDIKSKLESTMQELNIYLKDVNAKLIQFTQTKQEFIQNQKANIEIRGQKVDQEYIEQLNKNIAILYSEKNELEQLIGNMETKIIQENNKLKGVVVEIQRKKVENKQMQEQLKELEAEVQQNEREKGELANKQKALDQELLQLSQQFETQQQELQSLQTKANTLQGELNIDSKSNKDMIDQMYASKSLLQELNAKVSKYSKNQKENEEKIKSLISQIRQMEKYKSEVADVLLDNTNRLQDLELQITKQEEHMSLNETQRSRLEEQIKENREVVENLKKQIETQNIKKAGFNEHIQQDEEKLKKLQDEKGKLQQQFEDLQQQLSQFSDQPGLEMLERQIQQMNEMVQQLEQNNTQMEQNIHNTQQQLQRQMNSQTSQKESFEEQKKQVEQRIKQLELDYNRLKNQQVVLNELCKKFEEKTKVQQQMNKKAISQASLLQDIVTQLAENMNNIGKQYPRIQQTHQTLMQQINDLRKEIGKSSDTGKYQEILKLVERLVQLQSEEETKMNILIQGLTKYNLEDFKFDKQLNSVHKQLKLLSDILQKTEQKGNVRFMSQKLSNQTYSQLSNKLTQVINAQFARNVSDFQLYTRYYTSFTNYQQKLESIKLKELKRNNIVEVIQQIEDAKLLIGLKQTYNLIYILNLMQQFLVPLEAFKLEPKQLADQYKKHMESQNQIIIENIQELNQLGLETEVSKLQLKRNQDAMQFIEKLAQKDQDYLINKEREDTLKRKNPEVIRKEREEYESSIRLMKNSLQQVFRKSVPLYKVFGPAVGVSPDAFLGSVKKKELLSIYESMFNQISCEKLVQRFPIISQLLSPSIQNPSKQICEHVLQKRDKTLTKISKTNKDPNQTLFDWSGIANTLLGIVPVIQPFMQFVMLNMFEQLVAQPGTNPIFDPSIVNSTYHEFTNIQLTQDYESLDFGKFEPFFLELNSKITDFLKQSPEQVFMQGTPTQIQEKYKTTALSEMIKQIGINETSNVAQEANIINQQFKMLSEIQSRFDDISKESRGTGKTTLKYKKIRQLNQFLALHI